MPFFAVLQARLSLSARRAWIEMRPRAHKPCRAARSLSARRAWIEILSPTSMPTTQPVALRKESVDRNCPAWQGIRCLRVALRKESVDRNGPSRYQNTPISWSLSARRAWIEITRARSRTMRRRMSLSARRAWIEISYVLVPSRRILVALRKESVDRNLVCPCAVPADSWSLSARRAWIEIGDQWRESPAR